MALDFSELAERLRRLTVEVTDDRAALGSGLLWPPGHVVTSAHVVRGPSVAVRCSDGDDVDARLVACDRDADLAVLRLARVDDAPPLVADGAKPRIGALVLAVGHPLGLRGAVTVGIIHAIGPIVRGGAPWIHADVRLAPGNSGGPLADASGAIVGLNAMVVGGLALAVPMSRVLEFVRAAGVADT